MHGPTILFTLLLHAISLSLWGRRESAPKLLGFLLDKAFILATAKGQSRGTSNVVIRYHLLWRVIVLSN